MNNGVKRGAKVWIAKIIEMIISDIHGAVCGDTAASGIAEFVPDRPGSKNHAVRSSKGMGFQ